MTDAKLAEELEEHRAIYGDNEPFTLPFKSWEQIIAALRGKGQRVAAEPEVTEPANTEESVRSPSVGGVSLSSAATHQQNAAGQVGLNQGDGNKAVASPDPAAPTLAELDKRSHKSIEAGSQFRSELVNAYRAGRLREVPEGCKWSQADEDSNAWQTECGNMFLLNDGTPEQNDMKHCCYCGGKMLAAKDAP